MPVMLDWLIEGEVIYQYWWAEGTIDDARYVNRRMLEMFGEYPDRSLIHCIADATHQTKTESNFTAVRKEYTVLDHSQVGWVLLVIPNPLVRFACNIILQMGTKIRVRFMKNTDEGIDFLQQIDSTIDWERADWSVIDRLEAELRGRKQAS